MFRKVLIANRGEIAVRIMQTVQAMGMVAVAVYSEPDAGALHVQTADEAYLLPGNTAQETYLNIPVLLETAKQADVDAIHPGYGFLSENAAFAKACKDAKMTFIGPEPDVIAAMGDKIVAKKTMQNAGVPVVPGWTGEADAWGDMLQAAREIGYPILVKAAAGGGGKGMRLVSGEAELKAAVESAAREAEKAFGDARIFLEKYITKPRHIEFQIFGDRSGNVVHLFERECSIQRRHQKIIEESPSPALTPALREAMGKAALDAARAIGYTNAGTVEFILDETGQFYFLEVNTRLQVEHPVTELTTHHDLVATQLKVAMGESLPFSDRDLRQTGHAIECRIYAEDPANRFLPSTGKLAVYHPPMAPGVRVDSGVQAGDTVSVYYDPMLAKLITWGETRQQALEKMRWALAHYPVLGVTTNIGFLQAIFANAEFQAGEIDTHFLERHDLSNSRPVDTAQADLALAIAALAASQTGRKAVSSQSEAVETVDPWRMAGHWRGDAS